MLKHVATQFRTKTGVDLLWNYASLAVLAVSGVLINLVIAAFYGAEVLGVFNQIYSIYIMASQVAVCGVHFSTLKYVAQYSDDKKKISEIVVSGMALAAVLGASASFFVYLFHTPIGSLLESENVSKGLVLLSPSLLFFALNKLLISTFNGLRMMRTFASGQAVRYLSLIVFISFASISGVDGYKLSYAFIFSESMTLIFLFFLVLNKIRLSFSCIKIEWVRKHFEFGIKGFMSGILIEINSRVDVLMLGYFLNDRIVGVYSFVAMFCEGLYQFLIVIKNNLNPVLVRLIHNGEVDEIVVLARKVRKFVYPMMLVLAVALSLGYPIILPFTSNPAEMAVGHMALMILCGGVFISSGFVPFDAMFNQAGMPGCQTVFNLSVVITNIVLNVCLIRSYGLNGAALATALSYVLSVLYLNLMLRKININIIS